MNTFSKTTYPNTLLKILNVPNNTKISEKQMINLIILKCDKCEGYSRARYKIPRLLYLELVSEQYEINHIKHSSVQFFPVYLSQIKLHLKKIIKSVDSDDYIVLSSTFNNNPVYNIEVTI